MPTPFARRSISSPPLRSTAAIRREIRTAPITQEVGYSQPSALLPGLYSDIDRLSGAVDDLDTTLGWDVKNHMMRDPFVSGAINTLCLGAVARKGEVKAADSNIFYSKEGTPERKEEEDKAEEIAEEMRRNLVYKSQRQRPMELTGLLLVTGALKIGHQKAEIVLRLETDGVDKGKFTLDRIKSKPRETTAFLVDKQMNVIGVAAFTGDTNQLQQFQDKRVTNNASMFTWAGLGLGWEWLDREKFLIITHKPGEDDSPVGTSALRPAYAPWKMKRENYSYYLGALDNASMPTWIAQVPRSAGKMKPLRPDGTQDTNADPVDAAQVIHQTLLLARKGVGLATVPEGTKVDALHHATSGDPFAAAMSVFNSEITQALLSQQLATNESRHMARAAGQVHQDVLDTLMKYVRRIVCEAITRDVFGLLVRKNHPQRYWHLVPSYTLGEVELNDFVAWALAMGRLNESGLLHPSQYPAIWGLLGLPQADMDLFIARMEKEAGLLDVMSQPTVDPVTGKTTPAQLPTYIGQETGKTESRKVGRQIAARAQSAFSEEGKNR